MKLQPLILSILIAVLLAAAFAAGCMGGDDDDSADDDSAVADDTLGGDDSAEDDDSGGDDDTGQSLYVGTGDVYQPGYLNTRQIDLDEGEMDAPKAMRIYAPVEPGRYAVVQFQHGFLMAGKYYSEMLTRLASHGFIVVSPQMYPAGGLPLGKPTSAEEAQIAVEILQWLPDHLSDIAGVEADFDHLGVAGHSRGGKVIWTFLKQDGSLAKAVAGVDPVDMNMPIMGEYGIADEPFNLPIPSLVVGTGLGPVPLVPVIFPACAPDGENHENFYEMSSSPAYHIVASNYGHIDMLNDDISGCGTACIVCSEGPDRATMRQLAAGLLTAFFRASLQGDESAYDYLTDAAAAPTDVTMESK